VVTTSQPAQTAPDGFVVVLNDQDQHALWRAGLDVPPGRRRASAAMARSECLAAIDGDWPDIAPASVRAAAAGRRADGERFVHEAFAEQAVPDGDGDGGADPSDCEQLLTVGWIGRTAGMSEPRANVADGGTAHGGRRSAEVRAGVG
jgi:MbtH protein